MFFTRGSTEPLAYCHHDIMNVTLMQKNKKNMIIKKDYNLKEIKTARSAFPRTVFTQNDKKKKNKRTPFSSSEKSLLSISFGK